jgi:predicted alpha/beta-hydrolase family hydrolase
VDIGTSHGPARAELAVPSGPSASRPPSFLLVLTHGAGGSVNAPDLLAVRDAALRADGATALVTQPYRISGARAPGSPARQDEAWREIIAFLRGRPWSGPWSGPEEVPLSPGTPLIVGGRSNGARVACRTAAAVRARGVIALAFPLRPPGRRAAAGSAGTADPAARAAGLRAAAGSAGSSNPPARAAELRAAADGGARVLVVNGDRDPFGIPDPEGAIRVVVLKGESHALSRNPAAVAEAVTGWLGEVVPLVR